MSSSPRPSLSALSTALPQSYRSTPPSPLSSPIVPTSSSFQFPTSSSRPPLASNPSSTNRFHEALASLPSSTNLRHRPADSIDSTNSDGGFRFPDVASPNGDRTFDSIQKELGESLQHGTVGLGFGGTDGAAYHSGGATPAEAGLGGRFFDEPEALDTAGGYAGQELQDGRREFTFDDALQAAGMGRPASMDMSGIGAGPSGGGGADLGFLLSPPPNVDPLRTFIPSTDHHSRPFAVPTSTSSSTPENGPGTPNRPFTPPVSAASTPTASSTIKGKDRGRTFPAPLLLKADRPFGGQGSSSPVLGSVAPLSLPRKSSVSAGIVPSPNGAPSPAAPGSMRPPWSGSAASDNEDNNSPTQGGASAGAGSGGGGGRLDTVDLSHKRIAEVPVEVIEELGNEVEKLALGYNLLKELPMRFGELGRLRYLNIRVNLLSTFPQVLCEMPSLEILDISRNKIRRLPVQPGTLLNLKVFSFAKNRIKRLPNYIAQMGHLKVLKMEHNPLEWPPKEISTLPSSMSISADNDSKRSGGRVDDPAEMAAWLGALVRFIRENPDGERERDRRKVVRTSLQPMEYQQSDDEKGVEDRSFDSVAARGAGMTRTESGRLAAFANSVPAPRPRAALYDRPPGEEESSSRSHSRNASHTMQTLDAELRPALRSKKSLPDLRQPHADILSERRVGGGPEEKVRPGPGGSMNAALSAGVAISALRRVKDRPAGIPHSASARAALPTQQTLSSSTPPSSAPNSGPSSAVPTPPSSGTATPVARSGPRPTTAPTQNRGPRRPATPTGTNRVEFDAPARGNEMARTPSGGFDRNSGAYFRRLSMLPVSTISKAVPVALLEFADAIRGILFSLSQVYTALRQFVVFASQDTLPAPLARLMGTADSSTSLLINALDRFDSLSRRGTPDPTIVRDVFVTCRDNVATFKKLVAALSPELGALTATADVRYTRTLLLMLYGSTGEIAKSWNAVTPLLSEMSAQGGDPTLATLTLQPPTPSPTLPLAVGGSSNASRNAPSGSVNRARSKTRRHAGSFSVEDVQLGAVLPPATVPPGSTAPSSFAEISHTTTLTHAPSYSTDDDAYGNSGTVKARPTKSSRAPPPSSINLPPPPTQREVVWNAFDQPFTPGGALTFGDGSTDPQSAYSGPHPPPPMPVTRPTRSTSNANIDADETFLEMVDSTTGVAFDVYGLLLDSLDAAREGQDGAGAAKLMRELGPRRTKELTDLCILGNEVTTKLTGSLGRVRGPDRHRRPLMFTQPDAKRLGDDAYTFVQTVIRFAKLVKAISSEHAFAPQVREGVGQLTISTREFAKALSNTPTSFRPQPASGPPPSASTAMAATQGAASAFGFPNRDVAKDAFPFEWSKTKYLFAFGDSRIITNPDSDYPVTSQFKSWKEEFDPAQAGMSWKSEDTLFITWIGINDVLMSYQWTDYPAAYYNDLQVWLATQESLYEAGARQFLFFTVPPIHRTPELSPRSAQALRAVRTFNTELKTTIEGFRKRYRDANVMVYDAFHRILDQAQEEGIQLWNDAMHPHTGIHERIAIDVVKMFHELAEDEGKHKGEKGRGKGRKGKEDVTRKRPHWGSGH
ncbi:RAM signaling pathway, SOG2 [Pseudohyphozyma bogoriensis]|nr:RAM signaling pathway, SOG2 [Pseudohyphozyma bogoriensis]